MRCMTLLCSAKERSQLSVAARQAEDTFQSFRTSSDGGAEDDNNGENDNEVGKWCTLGTDNGVCGEGGGGGVGGIAENECCWTDSRADVRYVPSTWEESIVEKRDNSLSILSFFLFIKTHKIAI